MNHKHWVWVARKKVLPSTVHHGLGFSHRMDVVGKTSGVNDPVAPKSEALLGL